MSSKWNFEALGIFFVCTAALGLLYFRVIVGLVGDWINLPDFSHGFLIPLVSLYLAWKKKEKLRAAMWSPANAGLVLMIVGLLVLLFGTAATEFFTMRLSLLVVIAGMIVFLAGWEHFRLLLFPFFYLFFMIPIPSIILQKVTFPMQLFASGVATEVMQGIGVPVLREGNVIHLPHTSLEVAEACSGIRSLVSLLALGVIFSYVSTRFLWKRILLVAFCFPIAIAVNALRVSATGLLAQKYGLEAAQGFFHGFSGYALFLAALGILMAANFFLSKVKSG